MIAALQTVEPGVVAGALVLLQSRQPPIEAILAALLNGITNDVVLVLDGYHVVDSSDVHAGVAFLKPSLAERIPADRRVLHVHSGGSVPAAEPASKGAP